MKRFKTISLIELIIVLIFFGILLSFIVYALSGSLRVTLKRKKTEEQTTGIKKAVDFIVREIEEDLKVGFYGPKSTDCLACHKFVYDTLISDTIHHLAPLSPPSPPFLVIPHYLDTIYASKDTLIFKNKKDSLVFYIFLNNYLYGSGLYRIYGKDTSPIVLSIDSVNFSFVTFEDSLVPDSSLFVPPKDSGRYCWQCHGEIFDSAVIWHHPRYYFIRGIKIDVFSEGRVYHGEAKIWKK